MHGLFLLLLSAFLSILTVGAGPNVRGLAPVVLNVTHARHSPNNPQKFDNVTLWCSPDGPQVRITSAYFLRKKDGKRWVALVSPDKRNASYIINEPTVEDAGEYRCELETTAGKASFATHLYLRPVVVSDEHFAQEESSGQSSAIVLKASAILVTVESDVNLTCPAVGHPPLKFKWTKDGKPLEMSPDIILEGNTIRFKKVNYTNEGKYDCATVNEIERANDYPRSGTKKVKTLLTIERELRVKSQYAWLYPLALIIVIFIALFIIIIFCEMRKKRLSRKDLYVAQE